jgi:predicted KAP-like P-loop ATPase
MRYSDKPIDRASLDLLGRAGFALTLARSIDALTVARDGFVIAIQGEWGSGKTSLIEMICRYLRHIEMERTSKSALGWEATAVPKTVAELEDMAEIYERVEPTIAALDAHYNVARATQDSRWRTIRALLASDQETDIADRYWRLRERADADARTIILRFSPWLISARVELASALLSDLARAIGERLGDEVKQALGKLLKRLAEFAPLVGTGLDIGLRGIGLPGGVGTLATRIGSNWSTKIAERMTSGPTLDQIRDELRKLLANLKDRKIIIVVDDLDRLTPADALEMVSVIKSLGDLPNVVYILSYDEPTLSDLIHKAIGIDGHEFLEKIIQYPVRLPFIELDDLSRMIDADLTQLLPNATDEDNLAIQNAWYYVVRTYVQTPRDVRRLINSFAIAIAALREYTDVGDLFVLETLRLFDPAIYAFIRRHITELWD